MGWGMGLGGAVGVVEGEARSVNIWGLVGWDGRGKGSQAPHFRESPQGSEAQPRPETNITARGSLQHLGC